MENVIKTDVLVVGSGPGGFAAAVSAVRQGIDVLLVERYGFLGGMLSAGLVNPFQPSIENGFIFNEIVERLEKESAVKTGTLFDQPFIAFDPEVFKLVLFDIVREAKANLLLHTLATGVVMDKDIVKGVMVENKSGNFKIMSKVTVDATGDGDICHFARVPYEKGPMQPMTFNFRMAGVDKSKMPSRDEMNKIYISAKLSIPRENLLWFECVRDDEIHFNTTRIINADGTNVTDLTNAEVEGRRQMKEVISFIKSRVPGFGKSYLISTAAQVGVRETRRITGGYRLTGDDVLSCKKFDDVIARGSWPIDIHNPSGKGTTWKPLLKGKSYDIPYRCLVPQNVKNLIVAGRPISVTHEAFSSTRISPTCMAIGEATGVSAAEAVKSKLSFIDLDVKKIQSKLKL